MTSVVLSVGQGVVSGISSSGYRLRLRYRSVQRWIAQRRNHVFSCSLSASTLGGMLHPIEKHVLVCVVHQRRIDWSKTDVAHPVDQRTALCQHTLGFGHTFHLLHLVFIT